MHHAAEQEQEQDEVQLTGAPSGVYEVVYQDSKSAFAAVRASLDFTANGGGSFRHAVYTGGLIAASSCPNADTAAYTRGAVPHGFGKMTFDDGEEYEGNWRYGKRHGNGSWYGPLSSPSAQHESSVIGGGGGGAAAAAAAGMDASSSMLQHQHHHANTSTATTHAAAALPERGSYSGEWNRDRRAGKGTETFLDGRVYSGEFADGQCHGMGAQSFHNGDAFEGSFVHGLPHDTSGKAEYQFAGGDRLVGCWLSGKRHGQFAVHYAAAPQHSYQAVFSNDVMVSVSQIL